MVIQNRFEMIGNEALYKFFRQQHYMIHNVKKNMLGLVTGGSGDGKSWAAICYAYFSDPRFTLDKVVHTDTQFYNTLGEIKRVGEFVIWDEAGIGIPSKEWYAISNKAIGKTLQVFRGASRIGLLFTTQDISFIDSQSRKLLNYFFMMTERKDPESSIMIVRKLQINRYLGKMYMPYPRIKVGNSHLRLKYIKWDLPQINKVKDLKAMLEEYEKTSKPWKRQLIRKQHSIVEEYKLKKEGEAQIKLRTKMDILNEHCVNVKKDIGKYLNNTGYFDIDLLSAHLNIGRNDAATIKKLLEKEFKA